MDPATPPPAPGRSTPVRGVGLTACPGAEVLAATVAACCARVLGEALRARGAATLVCSGGSTPRSYLPAVAALPLPWERIEVSLADEREVPPGDAASNLGLWREIAAGRPAAAARLVGLPLPGGPAEPSAAGADAAQTPGSLPPYDLVLLGMGADGHVASLFPGSPQLAAALDPGQPARALRIDPPAGASPAVPRWTLSLAELLRSRRILVIFQGAGKRATFEDALARRDPRQHPVAALFEPAGSSVDPGPAIDFLWCP